MKLLKAVLCLAVLGSMSFAQAATHEIKMLNNGKDGIMVFDPSYLKAAKGDTIKLIPKDPSHNVASVALPAGAKPFKGDIDKPVTFTVSEEGVYLYECPVHVAMAMVGVIQVGKPTNLAAVQASGKELAKKFVMNKDRLDKIMAQVK